MWFTLSYYRNIEEQGRIAQLVEPRQRGSREVVLSVGAQVQVLLRPLIFNSKEMKQNWEKEFDDNSFIIALKGASDFNKYQYFLMRDICIDKIIPKAKQEERERILKNIGLLRQWLNERTEDRLITNEDIKTFLNK